MKNYKNMTTQTQSNKVILSISDNKLSLHTVLLLSLTFIFGIFTNDLSAQCETINLTCNDQINISINEDCYASINADLLLENPPLDIYPDNGTNYDVTIYDKYDIPLIPSNQVDQDQVGQTLKAKIELTPCGISCWGYVFVEDKIGPKIWGCVNGALPTLDIDCDEFSDGFIIDPPLLGSVCPEVDVLTFADDTTALDCNDEFAFNIFRVWTASDSYGNETSCNQTVRIRKYNLSDVVIPEDYVVTIDQNKDCSYYLDISPERTGFPTGIHCPNIMYRYTDIDYPQCGFQKKLLRDWFVIDWCTGQSLTQGQIIKYKDETAPRVANNIDTLSVGTDAYVCGALPILNPFRLTGFDTLGAFQVLDTCPDNITLTVGFLEAIPGQLQPLNVPYYTIEQSLDGTYELPEVKDLAWVRYCFTDECGNSTKIPDLREEANEEGFCHYFVIKAEDMNPPTPICEGFTQVPLGPDGLTEVFANTFDDNSYDACGTVTKFEVKRENYSCPGYNEHELDEFGESIHFCCQDLGDTITVRLRVFDMDDNYSECLGLVFVSDPRTPVVTCPIAEIDLDCGDDYTDHTLIGLPTGQDGCDSGIRIDEETFNLGSFNVECGVGTIVRIIKVTDVNDVPLKTCTQTIEIDPSGMSSNLEVGDYDFPKDVTIDVCVSGTSLDPIYTGIPTTIKEFGCSNIGITYVDDAPYVSNSQGLCYTIFRTWRVVDWCNYNPANPDAYTLIGTQEISITDSSMPIFNCPGDFTVTAADGQCTSIVDLVIPVSSTCNSNFDISWEIDAFSDGSIDYSGIGNDATDEYPAGEHLITFTGGNQCGGTTNTCSFTFTVSSNKPPIPICIATLTWSLGENGTTEIWASDFDIKSEGGCGLDDLIFSFVDVDATNYPQVADSYDCSDLINGMSMDFQVEIFIVDEQGRSSSCFSTLQLQDSKDACPDVGSMSVVSGGIITEMKEPIEEVMVMLKDMNNESSSMTMTSENGSFVFENVASDHAYNVIPELDEDHLNGVSTLDLVLLQRHILGIQKLDSPYKVIAGDVDNSNGISAIDLIQLRKLILGVFEELPESQSWAFVPEDHEFVDVNAPWDYPHMIELNEMSEEMDQMDFVAVKKGDVNNSAELASTKAVGKRAFNATYLQTKNANYNKGDLVAVPLIVDQSSEVLGMQFTLNFDEEKLLFEGIDDGSLIVNQENFSLVNKVGGALTFSFSNTNGFEMVSGQTLFTVYFEAKENASILNDISMSSDVTAAEVYAMDLETRNLELVVVNENDANYDIEVFQNEPNPFNNITSIAFLNSKKQNVSLTIFDGTGKVLLKQEDNFEKGVNAFEVNSDDLDASGILFYRIETQATSVSRKMILIR